MKLENESSNMSGRQKAPDMEYKQWTAAAACSLSFSSLIRTASAKNAGVPVFNKARCFKITGRLNFMSLYTSVLWKKSNKWTEPRKRGLFRLLHSRGHVNASDPIITIIRFLPAIRCLWSCKLAHITSAMSVGITFDSGNGCLIL